MAIGGTLGFLPKLFNRPLLLPEDLNSTLQMLYDIPHLAIIRIVILRVGIDEQANIFPVTVGVLSPVYFNTFLRHPLRQSRAGRDEPRVWAARPGSLCPDDPLRHSVLDSSWAAIRAQHMWLTLIVAKTISSSSGIGSCRERL